MDASQLPKGQSRESGNTPDNLPGIYVHKDTGTRYITSPGEEGVVQADALMSPVWKDSWERKGDVPTRLELQEMNKAQELQDAKADAIAKAARKKELEEAIKAVDAKLPEGGEVYEPELAKAKK